MTGIASRRETLGLVIWVGCLSKLFHMADRTIWQYAILSPNNCFVAAFAFHGGMRTNQREEVRMVADLRLGSAPALRVVALGAI